MVDYFLTAHTKVFHSSYTTAISFVSKLLKKDSLDILLRNKLVPVVTYIIVVIKSDLINRLKLARHKYS